MIKALTKVLYPKAKLIKQIFQILNKYIFAETQNLIQRLFRFISPLTLKIMKKYENIRNRTLKTRKILLMNQTQMMK